VGAIAGAGGTGVFAAVETGAATAGEEQPVSDNNRISMNSLDLRENIFFPF